MAALEHILLAYVAAWNETDVGKRRMLLETSWAEHGIYSDPTTFVSGREALNALPISVLLTSGIDEHHGLIQFT